MSEDYAIWDIDRILEAYEGVPEWQANVEKGFNSLFCFLERNGLVMCGVTNARGEVVRRLIMASDLTEEGKLLALGPRNPIDRWLDSNGRKKNPPDMKILERALAKVRAKK
uniref:hypothetical protein n=1 Tax=Pseudomonas laurentiana TaxID=2364649 RepID=UPI0029C86A0F|nr:hypothetical protein [Pseudomonas laurentiana]